MSLVRIRSVYPDCHRIQGDRVRSRLNKLIATVYPNQTRPRISVVLAKESSIPNGRIVLFFFGCENLTNCTTRQFSARKLYFWLRYNEGRIQV